MESSLSEQTEGGSEIDANSATLSPEDRDVLQPSSHGKGSDHSDDAAAASDVFLGLANDGQPPTLPGHKRPESSAERLSDTRVDDLTD